MAHNHDTMSMPGMAGMDMGSTECSMNMVGNWQTTNICILTRSWHIRTQAEFAGTCIGVFLMVFLVEMVRRWMREFDRWIVEQAEIKRRERRRAERDMQKRLVEGEKIGGTRPHAGDRIDAVFFGLPRSKLGRATSLGSARFRPTLIQQCIRSLFYGVQFTGAYIIMLIAMSYNGYILISIIFGGIFGHFFSTWDTLGSLSADEELDHDYNPRARAAVPQAGGDSGGVARRSGASSAEKVGDKTSDTDDDGISVESSDAEGATRQGVRRKTVGTDHQQQEHAYGTGTCCG